MQPLLKRLNSTSALTWAEVDANWTAIEDAMANVVTVAGGPQEVTGEKIFSNNLTVFGNGSPGISKVYILGVGTPSILTNDKLNIHDTVNDYMQFNMQNLSHGDWASADFAITADNGTNSSNFLDLGLNGSGYNDPDWNIVGALDGYLYMSDANFALGVINPDKLIKFWVGDPLDTEVKFTISSSNLTTHVPLLVPEYTGIQIADGEPADPIHKIYHVNDALYFNGSIIATCSPRIESVVSAPSVLLNTSFFNRGRLTLTQNVVIDLTGGEDGLRYVVELTQDQTGNHVATFGPSVVFCSDLPSYNGTLTAGKTDLITLEYHSASGKYRVVAILKGF